MPRHEAIGKARGSQAVRLSRALIHSGTGRHDGRN